MAIVFITGAVSMLTLQYAKALPDIKINCADPGSTATDLNGGRGVISGVNQRLTLYRQINSISIEKYRLIDVIYIR